MEQRRAPAKPRPQIIAIGGGFSRSPSKVSLERYVLAQARATNPRVCFIPTASGEARVPIARFYRVFSRLRCQPTHLSLFARTPALDDLLLAQDVICVGGGNTKSMLAVWDAWGLPSILRRAWRQGTVLAGSSAGAICWFETGVTDSWASSMKLLPCLGFLDGTAAFAPEARPSTQGRTSAGASPIRSARNSA